MSWLKTKVKNWLNSIEEHHLVQSSRDQAISKTVSGDGMHFTLYSASGGTVVETSYYDRKADRNIHSLHIINSEEDLGQGIAHIVPYEMLKR